MSLKKILNSFFFTEQSCYAIAIFRIVFSLLVLFNAFLISFNLFEFFGENAILSFESAKSIIGAPRLSVFYLLGSSNQVVGLLFLVHVVAALCLLFGFFTRVSALIVYVTLLSFQHRNTLILHSGDTLLRLYALYLIFSPAGKAFSLDRLMLLVRGAQPQAARAWPWLQRCIQLQLAWVYLATAVAKSAGPMWIQGTALYYVTRLEDFERIRIRPLLENMFLLKLMSWFTLIVEYAFPIFAWFKETRYLILMVGLAFHMGVELTMNVPLFQQIMLSAYILFVPEEDWVRLGHFIKQKVQQRFATSKATLYFDGDCGFCQRMVNVFSALDVFGLVKVENFRTLKEGEVKDLDLARCEKEIVSVDSSERLLGGFFAARSLFWRLPLVAFLNWVFYLPLISHLGDCVYKWVAANRMRVSQWIGSGQSCSR